MTFDADPTRWMRHLMPLPHEIAIEGTVSCRPEEVSIRVAPDAGEIERHAAETLERLFVERTGKHPEGTGFTILLGGVDASGTVDGHPVDTGRLGICPNSEQAYLIHPEGRNLLILAALNGRGVYYAARTLHQLLEPALTPEQVALPLVRVIDWPDLDERGMWNIPEPPVWIPWMASLKLNYGKMAATRLHPMERGKPNRADIDAGLYRNAGLKGFRYTPFIIHLNFLHDKGMYRAYPELAGQGDGALTGRYIAHKQGNQHRVPCASNPLLITILREWMEDIARPGADEVSCWLSERPGQCGCSACTAVGQFVLEARAFVAAWKQVRQIYPGFHIRLFLSTTTLERDYRILAETDPEVKIERACATEMERVTHLPRDLFVNPLLDHYAVQGRWIATYDVPISANGRVDTPEFKVPHRSAHRIRDYVAQVIRRRYSGAYGMMAWANMGREICGFNVCALAEWSWNLNGRTEKEFAVAWALREGYTDPEAVGAWAELMGPVEFDVYDSDFPICYSWEKAAIMVQKRQRPYLGEGMFRYYADLKDFDRKLRICDQALHIAETSGYDDLAHETRVVRSYIELARCVFLVAEQRAVSDLTDPSNQTTLWSFVERLRQAASDNVSALRTWRTALGPEPWHHRVHDAIQGAETTAQEIARIVADQDMY